MANSKYHVLVLTKTWAEFQQLINDSYLFRDAFIQREMKEFLAKALPARSPALLQEGKFVWAYHESKGNAIWVHPVMPQWLTAELKAACKACNMVKHDLFVAYLEWQLPRLRQFHSVITRRA